MAEGIEGPALRGLAIRGPASQGPGFQGVGLTGRWRWVQPAQQQAQPVLSMQPAPRRRERQFASESGSAVGRDDRICQVTCRQSHARSDRRSAGDVSLASAKVGSQIHTALAPWEFAGGAIGVCAALNGASASRHGQCRYSRNLKNMLFERLLICEQCAPRVTATTCRQGHPKKGFEWKQIKQTRAWR